jgi:hypothetical protein
MDHNLDSIRSRLIEITKIRDINEYLSLKDPMSLERETHIRVLLEIFQEEMKNMSKGVLKTKIGWKAPVIQSLRLEDQLLSECARRLAWELFPCQFSVENKKYVLGIENDPFYNPSMEPYLSDIDRLTIDSQKSSAEQCYNKLIRKMKDCYIMKSHQEPP